MLDPALTDLPPQQFWENLYRTNRTSSSGVPSRVLVQFLEFRPAGRALELGCAHGDDAIWLAQQGWQVTGVDISETVIVRARANVDSRGLADSVRLERRDLTTSFPTGKFDLVNALFLQSPVDFPRVAVLKRAAGSVSPGGLLLIASHGSAAPWSWSGTETVFPTPQEAFAELGLDTDHWSPQFIGNLDRLANGPDGQQAMVKDTVLVIERKLLDRSAVALAG